jgi:hypothetical protein
MCQDERKYRGPSHPEKTKMQYEGLTGAYTGRQDNAPEAVQCASGQVLHLVQIASNLVQQQDPN